MSGSSHTYNRSQMRDNRSRMTGPICVRVGRRCAGPRSRFRKWRQLRGPHSSPRKWRQFHRSQPPRDGE
eukprot:4749991-Pyramimonas_sp.AAC.1